LLYRPGLALIVVDKVRSTARHHYTRFFQIGPGIEVRSQGAHRVSLEASGLNGSLKHDANGVGIEQQLRNGQEDPLRGWSFPGFRTNQTRWTVRWRSGEIRNADFAATIGLECDCSLGARIMPSTSGTSVELTQSGEVLYRVTVIRDGDVLDVNASS
jgi:hypothetical protein